MSRWDISPEQTLDALVSEWIRSLAGHVRPNTADLYRMHWTAHLIPHFGRPDAISGDAISAYSRMRLAKVKRKTLLKERSSLRSFLEWAREVGYLDVVPAIQPLPRRAKGTPYELRRRGRATHLEPEEARAIIAALPRWSGPVGGPRFPVRARFVVMHETALRPATIDALSVPEHYRRGDTALQITDDIDKSEYGRTLPLTERAREALESIAPESGLIFGRHDYRNQLERAAKRVLDPDRARTFTAYDLRHARLTQLAESGDIPGVAYIAGHRDVNTTSIYVHPGLRAAKRVLDEAGGAPTSARRGLVGAVDLTDPPSVRRRGLEPPRVINPLEPESFQGETTTRAEEIRVMAGVIVGAASSGLDLPREYLCRFARLAADTDDIARLAVAVLDGGPDAVRKGLELCRLILAQARTERARLTEGA